MALPDLWNLDGRIAIVSGAGSPAGIGFATARALGELGAGIVLTATSERVHERAEELRRSGITAPDSSRGSMSRTRSTVSPPSSQQPASAPPSS